MPHEDEITHVSMSPKHRRTKDDRRRDPFPREEYAAAKRILKAGVGKKWDTTYAALKKKYPPKIFEAAIRRMIGYKVELNATVQESNGKKQYLGPQGDYIFADYFVHPTTGVLTETPERHNRWAGRELGGEIPDKVKVKEKHIVIDGQHYHKVEDTWYALTLKDIPLYDTTTWKKIEPEINDAFIALLNKIHAKLLRKDEEEETGVIPNPEHRIYDTRWGGYTVSTCQRLYGVRCYCSSYRQLGKKEIHKLKLNEVEKELPNIVRKK